MNCANNFNRDGVENSVEMKSVYRRRKPKYAK